jgi:hypothetical protein
MTGLSWEDDGAGEGLLTRRAAHKCLTEKEIEDFLFNRLSGVTREVVEEHLLVCQNCLDRTEQEEAYIAAARSAAGEILDEEFERALVEVGIPRESWLARLKRIFTVRSFQWAAAGAAILFVAVILVPREPGAMNAAEVALHQERGSAVAMAEAPETRPLTLNVDVSELPDAPVYRLELVDGSGKLVQAADVAPAAGKLKWKTGTGLPAGAYWVRLRDPAEPQTLVREFGLRVQRKPAR